MMQVFKIIAYTLVLIGALNWGLIGLFGFNLVGSVFGDMTVMSRIIYSLVGISAVITALTYHKCETIEQLETCEYGKCNF